MSYGWFATQGAKLRTDRPKLKISRFAKVVREPMEINPTHGALGALRPRASHTFPRKRLPEEENESDGPGKVVPEPIESERSVVARSANTFAIECKENPDRIIVVATNPNDVLSKPVIWLVRDVKGRSGELTDQN